MKAEKIFDKHEQQWVITMNGSDAPIAWITFENKKFSKVRFNFNGLYSREEWKMLAEIEKQISKIERSLK